MTICSPGHIRPDLLVTCLGDDPDWTTWDQSFAGTEWEGVHDGWMTKEGLETFVDDFSTVFEPPNDLKRENYTSAKIQPSDSTTLRRKNPGPYLKEVIQERLRNTSVSVEEAYCLIFGAEIRYRETQNPFWAWMILDIFLQAGLPPPPWVWVYLASAAYIVGSDVSDILLSSRRDKKRCRVDGDERIRIGQVDAFIRYPLELKKGRGKHGDPRKQFLEGMRDFQLAIRVSNLVLRDSLAGRPANEKLVGEACQRVSQQTKTRKRRVWEAYSTWFINDFHRNSARKKLLMSTEIVRPKPRF